MKVDNTSKKFLSTLKEPKEMKVDNTLRFLKHVISVEPHFVGRFVCYHYREGFWTFYIRLFHFKVLIETRVIPYEICLCVAIGILQHFLTLKDESRKNVHCTFHDYTSGMYLLGSGSLNSDLKNGKTLGEAVFNMSMKSGSKLPSKYKPLFHFSTSVQIPGMKMVSKIYGLILNSDHTQGVP